MCYMSGLFTNNQLDYQDKIYIEILQVDRESIALLWHLNFDNLTSYCSKLYDIEYLSKFKSLVHPMQSKLRSSL